MPVQVKIQHHAQATFRVAKDLHRVVTNKGVAVHLLLAVTPMAQVQEVIAVLAEVDMVAVTEVQVVADIVVVVSEAAHLEVVVVRTVAEEAVVDTVKKKYKSNGTCQGSVFA